MGSCFLHWIRARNNIVPLFGICSCDFCTLLNSSMKSYLLITFILILVYKFEAANVPVDADDVDQQRLDDKETKLITRLTRGTNNKNKHVQNDDEKAKKRTKNKKGTKNNKFKGVEGQGDRKSPKAKQKRIRKNNQSNKKGTPKKIEKVEREA